MYKYYQSNHHQTMRCSNVVEMKLFMTFEDAPSTQIINSIFVKSEHLDQICLQVPWQASLPCIHCLQPPESWEIIFRLKWKICPWHRAKTFYLINTNFLLWQTEKGRPVNFLPWIFHRLDKMVAKIQRRQVESQRELQQGGRFTEHCSHQVVAV